MAAQDEVVLLQRFCFAPGCLTLFFLCSSCDHGQRYCSDSCRRRERLRQRRKANRRYQQSPEGRLDHRDRQRRYRERCRQARVTDHSSFLIVSPASSSCGPDAALPPKSPVLWSPLPPSSQPTIRLCCRICGRLGRFIDPFPPIPQRR